MVIDIEDVFLAHRVHLLLFRQEDLTRLVIDHRFDITLTKEKVVVANSKPAAGLVTAAPNSMRTESRRRKRS